MNAPQPSGAPPVMRPYPGIRPFEEQDSPIFFGREAQINDLLIKLETSRFVAVVGSSGSGKSSMVKAGLLPTLKLGLLRDADHWHSLVIRAGSHPFRNLAEQILRRHLGLDESQALTPAESLRVEGIAVDLRKCPGGIADVLRQFAWPDSVHFALVIDQFEEIFGFRSLINTKPAVSRDDVERLVQLLLKTAATPVISPPTSFQTSEEQKANAAAEEHREKAADLSTRVWTVLTMRSDFIGQCEVFPALAEAVSNSQFLVPVLDEHQKADAILRPGQSVSGATYPSFEVDPALVRMIINDSGDQMDQLPLMQHSLMRTWAKATQRWSREGSSTGTGTGTKGSGENQRSADPGKATPPPQLIILPTDYVPLNEALDQHAEDAWKTVSQHPAQKALSRPFFLSLCDWSPDGAIIRRRPTVEHVLALTGATQADLESVIRTFQDDERNFILPIITGSSEHCLLQTEVLDISHEAFLRQWQTYRIWQEENRKDIAELRDLCRRSQRFQENSTLVLSKEDLDSFKKWKSTKTEAWAQRYVLREDWPLWQGIEKLFTASEHSFKQAERYKRAYANVALAFIFFGVLIALAAGGWAMWMKKQAQEAEQKATTRITFALQRLVGNPELDNHITDDERSALWEIAELPKGQELVRKTLLDYWFAEVANFSRGSKPAGDGIGTAMGLSLQLHQPTTANAGLLADKIANQGSSGLDTLGNYEENWPFFGQFLDTDALNGLLATLVEKLEKGTASDTALRDVAMVLKLISARSGEVPDTVKGDLVRASALLIKGIKNSGTDNNIPDDISAAITPALARLDVTAAATLAGQTVDALENLPELDDLNLPDPAYGLVHVLAGLLPKVDAGSANLLAKRAFTHLLKALEVAKLGDSFYDYGLRDAMSDLRPKLDAVTAAAQAEQILKKLEDPQEKKIYLRLDLADVLASFLAELDSSAVSLAQRGAAQVLNLLKNSSLRGSARDRAAKILAVLISKLDDATAAILVQQGVEAMLEALDTPSTYDASLSYPIDTGLSDLMPKLDAAAAGAMSRKLVQKLENQQPDASQTLSYATFRYRILSALKILALRLDPATAAALAGQLIDNSQPMDSARVGAFLGLVERLNAAAAKSLIQSTAEKTVQAMELKKGLAFSLGMLRRLQVLLTKLDAQTAATLALKAASQAVKFLEVSGLDKNDSPNLGRSLSWLATMLNTAAIISLAEPLLQELEHSSSADISFIGSRAQALIGLSAGLESANRQGIRRRLLSTLLSGVHDRKIESLAKELSDVICQSAFELPLQEKQIFLQYALEFRLNDQVPKLENEYGPAIENESRRITREALVELDVPTLANMLKWPECRGESRNLVLLALEQKTGREFHGDIWQFVTFATTNCTPGVDLEGPAHRVSLEEMLKAVSKALNLTASKH